jgi:two-component system sensor histidine kinase KdpD
VAAILGAADQLQRSPHTAEDQRTEIVREISEAANRLNELVQNLLDMTRLESGLLHIRRDWCDIADLVGTSLRKAEDLLHNHRVRVAISDSLPLIQADQGLLEQTLINLLRNAVLHGRGATEVSVDAYTEGNDCVIAVSDNGPGIPPGDVDRVFQKFYRSKDSSGGGIGLGLSIARGIVTAHGGTITCSNRAEGGAQFTIRIPLGSPPPSVEIT